MAVFITGGQAAERVNYVGYIQSSGSQFFDIGFKPNNNTRVVMDVELLTTTTQPCTLFGARQSATANNYAFMLTDGALRSDYNNTYTQTWAATITGRHKIDKNKETTTVDGVAKSYTNASFQAPCNLFLLALNNNGAKQWYTIARLYSCQVYDNGTLIRDYWPCYDEEGVLCLYDRVNKEYVYNAGTGSFTTGESGGSTNTISFSVAGTAYTAKENMTWAQWVNSSYNTNGYIVSGTYVLKSAGVLVGYSGSTVSPSDTIVAGRAYSIISV